MKNSKTFETQYSGVQILIEDYERRLNTANKIIDEFNFKDDSNPDYIRMKTKASCYRTFITELKRV